MDPRIHQITPGFYFIKRGWLNGNHFVGTGQKTVILDSGYYPDWPETERLIKETGARIEDTRLLISTHSHCDHIGGNSRIAARSGCQVAMHEVDKHFINQRNSWAAWYRYYEQEADFFAVQRGLTDGELLELGGLDWQVIHAPGHGMGQICLFAPDTGWLISADAAWDGDFGVLTSRIEGLDCPLRQADTLERLARLPVTTIYPGHGPIIPDGKTAIEKCRARIARFIEDPVLMGRDQVRKIMLYTIMRQGGVERGALETCLYNSPWYPEVCGLYFEGNMKLIFDQNLDYLLERGLVIENESGLRCTLPA